MYIITTDTHFGHEKIKDFGDRPDGFEELIIENLEKYANPTNILVHLGDIAWSKDKYWNRRLTSMPYKKKWLIRGNHDKKSDEWYLNNGWDFVGTRLSIVFEKKVMLFSHKPQELFAVDYNIHGHFHNIDLKRIQEMEPELFNLLTNKHICLKLEHHYQPFKLNNILREYAD